MIENPFLAWGLFLYGMLGPYQEEDEDIMARNRRKGKNRSGNIKWHNRSGGVTIKSNGRYTKKEPVKLYAVRFYTEGIEHQADDRTS